MLGGPNAEWRITNDRRIPETGDYAEAEDKAHGAALMRVLLCIAVLLNVWPAWGQTFNERYDLRDRGRAQGAWDIEPIGNGSHVVIQASSELDTVGPGLYLTHYTIGLTMIDTQDGTMLWETRFFPPWRSVAPGFANCCDTIPNDGFVIGAASQDSLLEIAPYLMVFAPNGDTTLTRELRIPGQDWNPFSTKRTQDGGFIIMGQTDATGYRDGFAIKTNAQGDIEWRRTYGESAPQTDGLLHVVQLPNGDYIMGGSKFPTNTTMTHWLQRTDPLGEVTDEALWPVSELGGGPHLSLLTNGHVLLASNVANAPDFVQDVFYLAEVDPADLSIVWEREFGAPASFQVLYAAKQVPNGDLIACGVSEEIGGYQGVLLRTTSSGDSLWMRRYFYQDAVISQGVGQFYDVLPTDDGGFIATGPVYSQLNMPNPPGYSQDAWVVKVDGQGCIVPGCNIVGISEQATNLLDAFSIHPNPAHGSTTLELTLPQSVHASNLELTLVSADGRVVQRERIVGNGTHVLDLSQRGAGIYYAHVASGGKWLTGAKLVVE